MRILFLKTLYIVSCLIAFNVASTLASELTSLAPKPFSAQSNYMSQLGYARWNHYRSTKSWPRSVEKYFETVDHSNDPDTISILWALRNMIKQNPWAREYVVEWYISRWGMDWHDEYTGRQIYRRHERKLLVMIDNTLQTHRTRRLDDDLLIQLLANWNKIKQNERDYEKAYKQLSDWWSEQK